jgi:hypothetical protein
MTTGLDDLSRRSSRVDRENGNRVCQVAAEPLESGRGSTRGAPYVDIYPLGFLNPPTSSLIASHRGRPTM